MNMIATLSHVRRGGGREAQVATDLILCRHRESGRAGSPGDSRSPLPPSSPRPLQSPPVQLPLCSGPWPSCCLLHSDLEGARVGGEKEGEGGHGVLVS